MKKYSIIAILVLFIGQIWAQEAATVHPISSFSEKDTKPQFHLGPDGLVMYLQIENTIKVSVNENENVLVEFVVEKDGSIHNAKVLKSSSERFNEEALRIVQAMPKWSPGKKDGKAVATLITLKVPFKPDYKGEPNYEKGVIDPLPNSDGTYNIVDDRPLFPGGEKALRKYISDNVRWPEGAGEINVQGKVYVRFIVSKTGAVEQVSVARGIHPLFDAEAIRVVQSLPDWTAGKVHGKACDTWFTVPINFVRNTKN